MPSEVILKSESPRVTEQDLRNTMHAHGYEVDEPGESQPKEQKAKPRVEDLYPKKGFTKEELQSIEMVYNHRCAEYREQFPDFGKEGHGLLVPNLVIFEVKRLANPAIAYHIARDREYLQKLWKMTPREQVMEVRRMHEGELKPDTEEGVTWRGSTKLRSGLQTTPAPAPRLKKGTLGAPATYQEFKARHNVAARESGRGHKNLLFRQSGR